MQELPHSSMSRPEPNVIVDIQKSFNHAVVSLDLNLTARGHLIQTQIEATQRYYFFSQFEANQMFYVKSLNLVQISY